MTTDAEHTGVRRLGMLTPLAEQAARELPFANAMGLRGLSAR